MELILLRHPAPAIDADICYGRADLTLQPGLEDPRRLPEPPPPFASLATSPLRRCRRLAERLGAERGVAVTVDPRLAEMDFGRWELRRWHEIARSEVDAWAADFENARPHGGETVTELRARVAAALAEARDAPGPALWVTHGGVVRAVCGLLGAHAGWETRLGFGQMLTVSA
ncbi:histidine phosphatase family protein [Amaricoccus solimangrovi]|uniref:histidine phosphatase family protein n=1 Tax=Amaricoccus solimangrovi TaxID=2589815 RepID=UPI0015E275FF|nr:histidine phosphatase family protein [Amaricoccus solimangrovi]